MSKGAGPTLDDFESLRVLGKGSSSVCWNEVCVVACACFLVEKMMF